MATTPQALLAAAKCYQCYASSGYMLQLIELGLLKQIVEGGGGGGGGGVLFTTGSGDPPTDGSVATQGYLDGDLDPPAKYINTNWPDAANPTWEAI